MAVLRSRTSIRSGWRGVEADAVPPDDVLGVRGPETWWDSGDCRTDGKHSIVPAVTTNLVHQHIVQASTATRCPAISDGLDQGPAHQCQWGWY